MDNSVSAIPFPQLSVIVSVYNQCRALPLLLSCFAVQEVSVPFEIVLCDDGSSDEIKDVVVSWSKDHPLMDLKYLWQPHRGFRVSRSRNNGIRSALGKVLAFVDCDVWLAPSFLQEHWQAHQLSPHIVVCGTVVDMTIDRAVFGMSTDRFYEALSLAGPESLRDRRKWLRTKWPWMACTSGNFSILAVDQIAFDEQFTGWGSEDRDYAYRLYASGLRLHLLDSVNVCHLRVAGEDVPWHPFKGGDHDSVIATLRSKLRLLRKYSSDLMGPSLRLVRRFHLDPVTDQWHVGPFRDDASEYKILEEFAAWQLRHGESQ